MGGIFNCGEGGNTHCSQAPSFVNERWCLVRSRNPRFRVASSTGTFCCPRPPTIRIPPSLAKHRSPGDMHPVHCLCGEGGIRTLGTVSRTQSFQDCLFDRSSTSPFYCIVRILRDSVTRTFPDRNIARPRLGILALYDDLSSYKLAYTCASSSRRKASSCFALADDMTTKLSYHQLIGFQPPDDFRTGLSGDSIRPL